MCFLVRIRTSQNPMAKYAHVPCPRNEHINILSRARRGSICKELRLTFIAGVKTPGECREINDHKAESSAGSKAEHCRCCKTGNKTKIWTAESNLKLQIK